MIRGRESFYRRPTNSRSKTVFQDSLGSVTITDQPEENIKLENVPEEGGKSLHLLIIVRLERLLQVNWLGSPYLNIKSMTPVSDTCEANGVMFKCCSALL